MEEISFEQVARIFRLHKRLFTIVFFSVLAVAGLIFLFTEVHYPVSASIVLQEEDSSMNINPAMMLLGKESQKILNEIEIIKSRGLLDGTIEDLNLFFDISRRHNRMINYLFNLITGKPLVEGSFVIKKYPFEMTEYDSVLETVESGFSIRTNDIVSNCRFNEDCSHAGGVLHVEKLGEISAGTIYDISYRNLVKTREYYIENLEAAPLGDNKESNTLQILLDFPDPHLAVRILSVIIERYMNTKISWKKSDADEQQKYITKIIADIKAELDQKSLALAAYQKENRTVLPDLQFVEIMKRDVEIEKDIAILQLKEQIITKFVSSIQMGENYPIPAPPVIDDLAVQNALQVHNALVAQEKTLSTTMSDTHPDLIKLRENIRKAKEDLVALLNKAKETYQNSAAVLRQQSATTANIINNLPNNLRNIATLQRDVEITEKLYAFLMQKYYEAGITANMDIVPVHILDHPTALMKKSRPLTLVFLFVSFLCALFFAVAATFIVEFFRDRVANLDECRRIFPVSSTLAPKTSLSFAATRILNAQEITREKEAPLFLFIFLTGKALMETFAKEISSVHRHNKQRATVIITSDKCEQAPVLAPWEMIRFLSSVQTEPPSLPNIVAIDTQGTPLGAAFSSQSLLESFKKIANGGHTIHIFLPLDALPEITANALGAFSYLVIIVEEGFSRFADMEKLQKTLAPSFIRRTHLLFIQQQ